MNKRQFKKMKEEFPPIPDGVDERVEKELLKELRSVPEKKQAGSIRGKRILAFGLAATVIAGSAFAAVKLTSVYSEKKGNYGLETRVETAEENNTEAGSYKVDYNWNYIPDGMSLDADGTHLVFDSDLLRGGITALDAVYDDESMDKILTDRYVDYSENIKINGMDAVYVKLLGDAGFAQRIYILCPDVSRVLFLYSTCDLSKEEFIKTADNLKLTITDEKLTGDKLTWEAITAMFEAGEETDDSKPDTKYYPDFEYIQAGESAITKAFVDRAFETVSVKVKDVRVVDDLSLLDTDAVPAEWLDQIDANGKLIPDTRNYIRKGDGINTRDEIAAMDTVNQKLVYVTVEYSNESKSDYNNVLYNVKIHSLKKSDAGYYFSDMPQADDEWDYIQNSSSNSYVKYHVVEGQPYDEMRKNYITSLSSGETKEVHFAFLVDEDSLENLYLAINGAETEIVDGAVYVDLGL